MKRVFLIISVFCFGSILAQNDENHPANLVSNYLENNQFSTINLLQVVEERSNLDLPNELINFEIFTLDLGMVNELRTSSNQGFSLPLSISQETFNLNLVRVDIFSSDFTVTEQPSGIQHKIEQGFHYRGVVEGHEGSIAAISISNDEVSGIISIPGQSGNMVLGKIENSSDHILYIDDDIRDEFDFICEAEPYSGDKPLASEAAKSQTTKCPEIFIDVGNDIHNNKGGVANATAYVTAVFNQVAILYANDNIDILLGGMNVWSSPESFSGLESYKSFRQSNPVAGDLNAYVNYAFSGGVAWLNGLCGSFKYSVSGINSGYSNVPTYSWSVEVLAHELGHNLGSPHTHACAWNFNDTAIDGCGPDAGYSEGCDAALPPTGGTVMSYCHLTSAGINFSNGFGIQPAGRISAYIDSSPCVANCAPSTSCSDGIQNGNETGVDCGGPDCPACPPEPCSDNLLTLTLNFDQYPEETSWTLVNGVGQTIEAGGTYGAEPDESTLIIEICVPNGCYDFNIFDSFGDGICCGYGNGSYSLQEENGNVLASGGSFADSETTNFCLNFNPNADCTVFETAPVNLTKSFDPVNGVEDRVQVKFYKAAPQTAYASLDSAACDILFWQKRYLDPETGQVYGDPIQNPDSILLSKIKKSNNNPLFKWPIKYRADGANNAKRVEPNYRYEWKVRCYCQKGDGPVSPWSVTKTFNTPNFDSATGQNDPNNSVVFNGDLKNLFNSFEVDLYPNPSEGVLNLNYKSRKGDASEIQVLDLFGKVVYAETVLGSGDMMNIQLELFDLAVGNYILRIHNDLQSATERFTVTK
ncbi:MAG: T9SS type A sorting domain-containing protein [Flavobacteriales bacterium]|nr:T9SS type A sorting domain-containing protein [Flavobacteriales bacterium]